MYGRLKILGRIPPYDVAIFGAGERMALIGAPRESKHYALGPMQHVQAASRFHVPQPHGRVRITRARKSEALAGAPRYSNNPSHMPFEHAQTASGLYVPQPHGRVVASG